MGTDSSFPKGQPPPLQTAGAEGWAGTSSSTVRLRCPCPPARDRGGEGETPMWWGGRARSRAGSPGAVHGVEKWITLNSVSRATHRNAR